MHAFFTWYIGMMAYFALLHTCNTSDHISHQEVRNIARAEASSVVTTQGLDEWRVRQIARSECQCH